MGDHKIRLEIERHSGIEVRSVARDGTAAGSCPGCGAYPFHIHTHPPEQHGEGLRAGSRCVACADPVGWVYVSPQSTIFGREEDEAVLTRSRARVY